MRCGRRALDRLLNSCNPAAGRTFTTRRFLNSLDNRAPKHDDGQDLSIRSGLQSTRAERFETLRDNTAFPGLLLTCACQKLHQPQDWVVQEGIEGPREMLNGRMLHV